MPDWTRQPVTAPRRQQIPQVGARGSGRGNAQAQDQLQRRVGAQNSGQAVGQQPEGGDTDTTQCAAPGNGGLSEKQISAAIAWASTEKLGTEAITSLQQKLGVCESGAYDQATVVGVYTQQKAWTPKGTVADPGKATRAVFQRLGLIFTNTIENAAVTDADAQGIEKDYPDGVTVAVVPQFKGGVDGAAEFASQAKIFAKNQGAIGLGKGGVVRGAPVITQDLGDVVESVQAIHRGLLAKSKAPEGEVPEWTKVKNLALFSHGENWGMGMNANNDFSKDGLHNNKRGDNPSNIEAFAKALEGALAGGVRVQLFACNTGGDKNRTEYEEWTKHDQGDRAGDQSMAASLSTALGPEASVYGHTTAGHTTENFAARVFGADAGEGKGGLHLFDSMYPESFVQSELTRLYADKQPAERTARHDSLRELMWSHFKDSVTGEHGRSKKRYTRPIGQEMFTNPETARSMLHTDWTTWSATRLSQVKAKK